MMSASDYFDSNSKSVVCATTAVGHRNDAPTAAIPTIKPAVSAGIPGRSFASADTSTYWPDSGGVIVRYVWRGKAKIRLRLAQREITQPQMRGLDASQRRRSRHMYADSADPVVPASNTALGRCASRHSSFGALPRDAPVRIRGVGCASSGRDSPLSPARRRNALSLQPCRGGTQGATHETIDAADHTRPVLCTSACLTPVATGHSAHRACESSELPALKNNRVSTSRVALTAGDAT